MQNFIFISVKKSYFVGYNPMFLKGVTMKTWENFSFSGIIKDDIASYVAPESPFR